MCFLHQVKEGLKNKYFREHVSKKGRGKGSAPFREKFPQKECFHTSDLDPPHTISCFLGTMQPSQGYVQLRLYCTRLYCTSRIWVYDVPALTCLEIWTVYAALRGYYVDPVYCSCLGAETTNQSINKLLKPVLRIRIRIR